MKADWYPDPSGQFEYRWWDGNAWTEQVASGGNTQVSPVPEGAPAPGGQTPTPQHHSQHQGQGQGVGGGYNATGISGPLLDGRFSESESEAIANQNSKMFRVRVGEPFLARQGSMIAYQGNIDFNRQGSGSIGKFMKKMATGEGLPLMRVEGQGDVFLAERANDVHLMHLNNSAISINGRNVLAFSASLQWDVQIVGSMSAMMAGGLANTILTGTGWVAVITDGPPVVLNTAEAPTFADSNAIVGWSANLQTNIRSTMKAKDFIGLGSGEMFQVGFQGQGFVIVQPSEGYIPVAAG